MHRAVRADLAEVEPDWLWWQPAPESKHIGFLCWHLVRDEDVVLSHLAGERQAWQREGWHHRFGIDPAAQGTSLSPGDVASFRYDLDAFAEYRERAWALTPARLARIDPATRSSPAWPGSEWNMAQQLVEGCLCHSWLHLGEIRNLMGLRGWRFHE